MNIEIGLIGQINSRKDGDGDFLWHYFMIIKGETIDKHFRSYFWQTLKP